MILQWTAWLSWLAGSHFIHTHFERDVRINRVQAVLHAADKGTKGQIIGNPKILLAS